MEDRIVRLEERYEYHEREIASLKEVNKEMSQKLDAIVKTLSAVRNWLIGAIVFAVAEQVGFLEIIKKAMF